uniref:Candidate secreted effector n=1 Tax=Meloidogyne incognita TaxID=6306 RepID=A0A914NPT4_MELIC
MLRHHNHATWKTLKRFFKSIHIGGQGGGVSKGGAYTSLDKVAVLAKEELAWRRRWWRWRWKYNRDPQIGAQGGTQGGGGSGGGGGGKGGGGGGGGGIGGASGGGGGINGGIEGGNMQWIVHAG